MHSGHKFLRNNINFNGNVWKNIIHIGLPFVIFSAQRRVSPAAGPARLVTLTNTCAGKVWLVDRAVGGRVQRLVGSRPNTELIGYSMLIQIPPVIPG